MTELTFQLDNKKVYLVLGQDKKEIDSSIFLETCQNVLTNLSDRDYKNITSINKLLRIISTELLSDDSDEESNDHPVVSKGVTDKIPEVKKSEVKKPIVPPSVPVKKSAPAPINKKPVQSKINEIKNDSSSDEEEQEDEDDD